MIEAKFKVGEGVSVYSISENKLVFGRVSGVYWISGEVFVNILGQVQSVKFTGFPLDSQDSWAYTVSVYGDDTDWWVKENQLGKYVECNSPTLAQPIWGIRCLPSCLPGFSVRPRKYVGCLERAPKFQVGDIVLYRPYVAACGLVKITACEKRADYYNYTFVSTSAGEISAPEHALEFPSASTAAKEIYMMKIRERMNSLEVELQNIQEHLHTIKCKLDGMMIIPT